MNSIRALPRRRSRTQARFAAAIIVFTLLLGTAPAARADLRAGVEAYLRGDYASALETFAPLAEAGDGEAQFYLGSMYEGGLGVAPNAAIALDWFRKSAENDVAQAEYHLGLLYEIGETVERDYARAAEWYLRAAEQGYAPAQNNLGSLYLRGLGVEADPAEAYFWISLALKQDYPDARGNHSKAAAYVSSTDKRRIDDEVDAWTPKHH